MKRRLLSPTEPWSEHWGGAKTGETVLHQLWYLVFIGSVVFVVLLVKTERFCSFATIKDYRSFHGQFDCCVSCNKKT
jgi:hypothetical protein